MIAPGPDQFIIKVHRPANGPCDVGTNFWSSSEIVDGSLVTHIYSVTLFVHFHFSSKFMNHDLSFKLLSRFFVKLEKMKYIKSGTLKVYDHVIN